SATSTSSALITFFFFHLPPPAELYPLSLHDALPIFGPAGELRGPPVRSLLRCRLFDPRRDGPHVTRWVHDPGDADRRDDSAGARDRKSTRLNSSHDQISYAVFCLKKKKKKNEIDEKY